jgi:hypothetical protein
MRRFAPRSNAMAKQKSQSVPLVWKRYRAQTEPSSVAHSTSRPAYTPSAHTRVSRGKRSFNPPEHQLAAIAVLHIGAGDRHGQNQTQYIDHDMPLTTLGVLREHRSPDRPLLLRCHALAVHNCCARINMSAFANPYLIPELIMNPVRTTVSARDGESICRYSGFRPGRSAKAKLFPESPRFSRISTRRSRWCERSACFAHGGRYVDEPKRLLCTGFFV